MEMHYTNETMAQALRGNAEEIERIHAADVNGWVPLIFDSCDAEALSYVCHFDMRKEYANPNGVLHGGLIAFILDTSMGHFSCIFADHITPTISMSVNYLRPIPVDRPIYIRVKLTKSGVNINYLTAEAYCADDPNRILATASGAYSSANK